MSRRFGRFGRAPPTPPLRAQRHRGLRHSPGSWLAGDHKLEALLAGAGASKPSAEWVDIASVTQNQRESTRFGRDVERQHGRAPGLDGRPRKAAACLAPCERGDDFFSAGFLRPFRAGPPTCLTSLLASSGGSDRLRPFLLGCRSWADRGTRHDGPGPLRLYRGLRDDQIAQTAMGAHDDRLLRPHRDRSPASLQLRSRARPGARSVTRGWAALPLLLPRLPSVYPLP